MLTIGFNLKGERESIGAFDAFDYATKDKIKEVLRYNAELMRTQMAAIARDGLGELKKSIHTNSMNDGLTVQVKAARRQWVYQEWGMGPLGEATSTSERPNWLRRKPLVMPDYRTLRFQAWVRKKTGSTGPLIAPFQPGTDKRTDIDTRDAFRSAFLIARAIKRKGGIAADPFVRPVIDANIDRIRQEMRAAVIAAADETGARVRGGTNISRRADGVTVLVGDAQFEGSRIPGTKIQAGTGGGI